MVSKESDYLIHLAEMQLDRLNKSLYIYQQHSDMQENLLEGSFERFDWSLSPLYEIIDKQRRESHSRRFSASSGQISPIRKQVKKTACSPSKTHSPKVNCNDNHIRDWRDGAKLARKTFGPSKQLSIKGHFNQTQSACSNRKEKLSTFWDYNGHKRTGKISKSVGDMEKSEKSTNKCCGRGDSYSKSEIRKYIRDKQKSYKEKQFESSLKEKVQKESLRNSLMHLNESHYDDFRMVEVEHRDHFCTKLDKFRPKRYGSYSSLRKERGNQPIFDELKKEGVFDYRVPKKIEYSKPQCFCRPNNGFNSTVDSGFETGEWIRTSEALRTSKQFGQDQVSSLPPKSFQESPIWIENSRERSSTPKSNGGYHQKSQKEFMDYISAYDASSENEMGYEIGFTQIEDCTPPPSPNLSLKNEFAKLGQNSPEDLLRSTGNIKGQHILDGKMSISLPNCHVDLSHESSLKRSQLDLKSQDSSRTCLVDELKQALLDAQKQLNPNLSELNETLSEKISQAVQNFIKAKEQNDKFNVVIESEIPVQYYESSMILHHPITSQQKTEFQTKKDDHKKDQLSTEFEATEIESEKSKQLTKPKKNHLPSSERHDIKEIPEENSSLFVDNDQSEVIDELTKENITANLVSRKIDLQSRKNKANELIKLTQEFRKETKKVKLLEKKACKLSRKYISDPKFEKYTKLHGLRNSNISKLPRYAIPPDGKDSGRSEIIENTANQLSPKMGQTDLGNEKNKEDSYAPEISSRSISILSDADEPTASISEVSTTLTDQSELEARLVALQAEMSKKHALVAMLKIRQKEMKRDSIKQKEIILQKQIDMYDAYILNLQDNVDQLNSKIDEIVSEESHTLRGSTNTINDLDSKIEEIDEVFPMTAIEIVPQVDNKYDEEETNIEVMYIKCCKDYPEIKEESFDKIVDNNKEIAEGDIIKSEDEIVKCSDSSPEISDLIIFPKDYKDKKENVCEINNIINKENVVDKHVEKDNLEEMMKRNLCDEGFFNETDLNKLYLKECNSIENEGENQCILDELLPENIPYATFDNFDNTKSILNDKAEVNEVDIKSTEQSTEKDEKNLKRNIEDFQEKKVDISEELKVKQQDTSTEIFIAEENKTGQSYDNINQGTPHSSNELDSISRKNIDEEFSKQLFPKKENDDETEEYNIKFPASSSDDDCSTISDVASIKFMEEDSPYNADLSQTEKPITKIIECCQDINSVAVNNFSPVIMDKIEISEANLNENDSSKEPLNSAKVEQLVEYLLNAILFNEIESVKVETAKMEIEQKPLLSVSETRDFNFSPFITSEGTTLCNMKEETPQYSAVSKADDSWEFTDVTVEEPTEIIKALLQSSNNIENKEEVNEKNAESISIIDKQLLSEKIKWLIPLKPDYLDSHIDSAIKHFFNKRQLNKGSFNSLLLEGVQVLPSFYTDTMSIVTDSEVGEALFDSSKQLAYIDKRIVFELVKETFAEIYSVERYLPQMPWVHSSFMMKRKNYTTWRGDKPPESYDLVRNIVQERICLLFDPKNIFLDDVSAKNKESSSHSKITKWCIERQKDQVDKLLINDLRKEENDWVYYDEAEEEVKIQIAEDVFNLLVTDTTVWLNSFPSQNGNC